MKSRSPMPIGPLESIQACTPGFVPPRKRAGFVSTYLAVLLLFFAMACIGRFWI